MKKQAEVINCLRWATTFWKIKLPERRKEPPVHHIVLKNL